MSINIDDLEFDMIVGFVVRSHKLDSTLKGYIIYTGDTDKDGNQYMAAIIDDVMEDIPNTGYCYEFDKKSTSIKDLLLDSGSVYEIVDAYVFDTRKDLYRWLIE